MRIQISVSASYTHKELMKEYARNGSLQFNHYLCEGDLLRKVSPMQFKKSTLPDLTKSKTKLEQAQFLATRIKQFNKRVEYNSWLKRDVRTAEEQLEKLQEYI